MRRIIGALGTIGFLLWGVSAHAARVRNGEAAAQVTTQLRTLASTEASVEGRLAALREIERNFDFENLAQGDQDVVRLFETLTRINESTTPEPLYSRVQRYLGMLIRASDPLTGSEDPQIRFRALWFFSYSDPAIFIPRAPRTTLHYEEVQYIAEFAEERYESDANVRRLAISILPHILRERFHDGLEDSESHVWTQLITTLGRVSEQDSLEQVKRLARDRLENIARMIEAELDEAYRAPSGRDRCEALLPLVESWIGPLRFSAEFATWLPAAFPDHARAARMAMNIALVNQSCEELASGTVPRRARPPRSMN